MMFRQKIENLQKMARFTIKLDINWLWNLENKVAYKKKCRAISLKQYVENLGKVIIVPTKSGALNFPGVI